MWVGVEETGEEHACVGVEVGEHGAGTVGTVVYAHQMVLAM